MANWFMEWPASPRNNLAPWHEMARRFSMAVPFFVLIALLSIVVLIGWGRKEAADVWKHFV